VSRGSELPLNVAPSRKAGSKTGRKLGRPSLSDEALLAKAMDLFLENGFERTSIDAITAAAGMAKRTFYLRFNDKITLFKAALAHAINAFMVPIERLREAETEDLEATLLRIGQILVANVMSPAGLRLLRITNAESARLPEIGAYSYRTGTEPTLTYLAELFRRRLGPKAGTAQDFDDIALAFLNLVVGGPPSMAAWGVEINPEEVDRHTRFCVRLFLHGLPQSVSARDDNPGIGVLEDENRRLRSLLVEQMLKLASLNERLGKSE
jgi:AcrR family transcriptional regulator